MTRSLRSNEWRDIMRADYDLIRLLDSAHDMAGGQ
jgi:hypothetical protein